MYDTIVWDLLHIETRKNLLLSEILYQSHNFLNYILRPLVGL